MFDKIFENKDTGEMVKVTNDDGIWFTLNNGAKIKKESFFNKYTEHVDPSSFFSTTNISGLAQEITRIDPNKVITDNTAQPYIKRVDPITIPDTDITLKQDEKQRMIDEYNRKQKELLSKYKQIENDDESANNLLKNNPNYPEFDKSVKRDRDRSLNKQSQSEDYYAKELYEQPRQEKAPVSISPDVEAEAYKFFRGFKKVYPVQINLKFDEKIAEPEFLKLMSNNFEADVIQFYTRQIYNNIVSNMDSVEQDIYDQLYKLVFGKKRVTLKETSKKTTTKRKTKQTIENLPYDKMIPKKDSDGNVNYIFIDNEGKDILMKPTEALEKGYKPKLV